MASKLYPAGATTNSDAAVKGIEALYPVFQTMSDVGMLLLIHGEVTENHIDIFDREAEFIERHLKHIVAAFPDLKIVFEHITTADAADFVLSCGENVAATITPQHLMLNRNDLLVGGIKPHNLLLTSTETQHSSTAFAGSRGIWVAQIFLRHRLCPA